MKILLITLFAAVCIAYNGGCAAKATVGNEGQHGAAISAKTEGHEKGVHATAY